MKMVRIMNNEVQEILPDTARPVADWYGEAFAAQCVEAPDEVEQHWTYDPEAGTFSPPAPYEPEPQSYTSDDLMAALLGLEVPGNAGGGCSEHLEPQAVRAAALFLTDGRVALLRLEVGA